jgi:hypothetical protein
MKPLETGQAETEPIPDSNQNIIQRRIALAQQDLDANRHGILSRRQRWTYAGVRLAEHLIGLLMACLGGRVIAGVFQLAPDMDAILVMVGLAAIITLALFVLRARPAFSSSVKSVTGQITRRVITSSALLPFFSVTVDKTLFYVTPPQFEMLEDDAQYTVFFVERPLRVGGSVLLSVEPHDHRAA